MSRSEKALDRLLSFPKDFTWAEMQAVLGKLGYEERRNSGSRRKFVHSNGDVIILHQPHPDPVVKHYALKQVVEKLKNNKMI